MVQNMLQLLLLLLLEQAPTAPMPRHFFRLNPSLLPKSSFSSLCRLE
jgi:hypothetical protein